MTREQNQNIDDLLQKEKSVKLEYGAFEEIKMTNNNRILYVTIIILSIFIGYILAFCVNTQEKFDFAVGKFMEIDIAFIAIIFGAYSLFQAMISDDFLLVLSKVSGQIKKSNKSFLNLLLLYLYAIIINLILIIGLRCLDDGFLLFSNLSINNCICMVAVSLYFWYNILIIVELKNFAINLYRMFNLYNAYKISSIGSNSKRDVEE